MIGAACYHKSENSVAINSGSEGLVPVGTGMITNASGGDFIGYGLYAFAGSSRFGEEEFLLVLRNINSKFINLAEVTADNFKLQDSKGRNARLVLRSLPQNAAWQQATSLQLATIDFTNASNPLTLTFKATFAGVPASLCITNIEIAGNNN
jgi:hypothetical protein